MPLWMHDAIRLVLDHTGNGDTPDSGDITAISLVFTSLASWAVVAFGLLCLYLLIRLVVKRCRGSRKTRLLL
ncbi:protein of unknown function (plasmid) [Caballeronia sp. S22]